ELMRRPSRPRRGPLRMKSSPSPISPRILKSASGLTAQMNVNGSMRRMTHGGILLNLFLGNEAEGGPANIYLRRHGDEVDATALIGPRSCSLVQTETATLAVTGEWRGIHFLTSLVLADSAPAWFWHLAL